MTCITPSHEEAIAEGETYEILDTIKALEQQTTTSEDMDCLLGKGNTTPGKTLPPTTVDDALAHMQQIQGLRQTCDIEFLKAQMYKDYRNRLEPSVNGSKETEEQVSSYDPTIMEMETEQQRGQKHDMEATHDMDALPSPPDFDASPALVSSSTSSHHKRSTPKRVQRKSMSSTSTSSAQPAASSSTSVIFKPYPRMIPAKISGQRSIYKNPSRTTSHRHQEPDIYFAGKNVYLGRN
jgi:hypothetical protein